jgi:TetR/AcrR family transcriptional repressor of nem operon
MRDPARTKELLLETAIGLVRKSNYDHVGVEDICKNAGVTKGAFYHHFESKADLYSAAADHYWSALRPTLDSLCSPSYTPLEQLENLIDFVITRQRAESLACCGEEENGKPLEVANCPFFTCGVHVGVEEEKVRQATIRMAEKSVRYYEALARGLRDEGVLEGTADTAQIARLLFQYMQGLQIYGRVKNSVAAIEVDLREGVYRILGVRPEYRRQ